MKIILKKLARLFGFDKTTRYVNDYLHEANIKSSVFMTFIIVVLETWMVIRSIDKYVIPRTPAGADFSQKMEVFLLYTSKYWLFMLLSIAVLVFALTFNKKGKMKKSYFILNTVLGSATTLYSLMLIKEPFQSWTTTAGKIQNTLLLSLYISLALIGIALVLYSIFKYKGKRIVLLEHAVITVFALVCLIFGIMISHSDFGKMREIMCFLTMIIYVGCLVIYRPWVTILLLTGFFYLFHIILKTVTLTYEASGKTYQYVGLNEYDIINYITFLISLVTICISIYHHRKREAEKTEQLERLAERDELTNLFNYSHFNTVVQDKIKHTSNFNSLIYLFINIKNFKAYNYQKGFSNGNIFLRSFGELLAKEFKDDIYAYQADDHFVVLADYSTFREKIDFINDELKNLSPDVPLTIKVGGYVPEDPNMDSHRAVDRARYAASLINSNYDKIYIEYDESMQKSYQRRLYVINNIDRAVEEGWIVPFYQPVVWTEDGELCGCEALARWIDPELGPVYPNDFIPVLEDSKLIHKLDKAIFEAVCKDLRRLIDENKPVVPVSLNFSRLDFELMDAVGVLDGLVKKYDIPKNLLHVEITESALIGNMDTLSKAIATLKELGFAVWLDDFGSGYSSLNVLKDYKFDVLKIDMVFLSNIEHNESAKVLIDFIIRMSDKLDMLTLTEGVETQDEVDFLKSVGCGRLQGYFFGKPMPLKELLEKIDQKVLKVSEHII